MAPLTWSGCSEETGSPVAPSPATAAAPAVVQSAAARSVPVDNEFRPQVNIQIDGGLGSTAIPDAGFVGGTASPAAPIVVLDRGVVPTVAAGPGWTPGLAAGPSTGLNGGSAPAATAGHALEDGSPAASSLQLSHDSDPAAVGHVAGLKASAPVPESPIDDIQIPELRPTLTVTNAEPDASFLSAFAEENFQYQFEIYKVVGGSRTPAGPVATVPGGTGSTSYRVARPLDRAASYQWRARAYAAVEDPSDPPFAGEHGPWSDYASFRTAALILGVPLPLTPVRGARVDVDTGFTVRNPPVEGTVVGRVLVAIQVATDGAFDDVVTTGSTHARDRGETTVAVDDPLLPSTTYYWRARAEAESATGPVIGAWSDTATFRTVAAGLGPPTPLAPIDGATVGVGTHFTVRNGRVTGISGTVYIQIEVATSESFAGSLKGRTHARPRGETIIPLDDTLRPNQQYHWRARSEAGSVLSDWSAIAHFRTSSGSTSGPAGPFGPGGNPRNMFHVVREIAQRHPGDLRNSCQGGGGSWRFMDLLVERLRQESGRWGYNCKRGDCAHLSEDVVAYYRGAGTTIEAARGSTDVAIIDVIAGHCGPNPQPSWLDLTHETAAAGSIGRWKYPR